MHSLWEKSIAVPHKGIGSRLYGGPLNNSTNSISLNLNEKSAAVVCGICTLLILISFQPPFVQIGGKESMEEGHLSPGRCVLGSIVVATIAYMLARKK